jgi:isoleucyl-tRNA synthetase
MPGFAKVEASADFSALEREVLQFWDAERIFEKRRALNAGKPKWSFLDGPITANNPMGVHHAWGRTYKDAYNRYFAMSGHELRYQNGFDCQGLWVEVEVEKELGLKSKRDIENLVPGDRVASIAKFVQLCKDRVDKYARVQSDQSIRLGMWMDWDRTDADWARPVDDRKSYFTMSDENNYTIWSFLKKCHGKGMIARGYDAMPWCGRCGVGISEQEMKEGYKMIEHRAVFVKFPLWDPLSRRRRGVGGEGGLPQFLLVWTTTPWTLTSNVGAAVNPELTYLKVQLKGEIYYVSKGAFKLDRMASGEAGGDDDGESGAKKGKRAWLDGVPHLKSIEQMFKEKAGKENFTIVGEVKGEELLGWEYDGPFDDLPAQQSEYGYPGEVAKVVQARGWAPSKTAAASHRIVSGGKDVTDTEGTGIVHTAPGCGQIDFQWGKDNGLPPVAPLDDGGLFLEGFGSLAGNNAVDAATADAVFDILKSKNLLFAIERYVHRYPHCWRCKTELLYRLVDEWFISMGPKPEMKAGGQRPPVGTAQGDAVPPLSEEWDPQSFRTQIKNVAEKVTFLPESLGGQKREIDWLRNMGDWMISKKRYWGLALPIWVDEVTGDFEVLGSKEELKARAVEGWSEFEGHSPHRPHVDNVKIRNPKTGNLMSRVPDVGNPWLDAGIVGFSTMKYNIDRDYWRQWYPADFITESFPGQFRNWFYALLALSTMMSDGEPPFKTLLGFATVKDQYGHDMHKTAGNSIEFVAAADKGGITKDPKGKDVPFTAIGADVMRWLYCRQSPAQNLLFGPEPADEVRSRFIFKLWNTYAFFCNCAPGDKFDPSVPAMPVKDRPDIDRWILSGLQGLVKTAREGFEKYDVMSFALAAERFIDDDLSNWYVRRVKPRLNSKLADLDAAGVQDKYAAYHTLYSVLTTLCKLLAPCVPFIVETMWKNLKSSDDLESVHLCDYPVADETLIDEKLNREMETLRDVITLGGAARNVAKIKVRQPLSELIVRVKTDEEAASLPGFEQLIRDELNVKKVIVLLPSAGTLLTATAKLNKKTAASKLGAKLKEAEAELAKRNAAELAEQLRAGPVEIAGIPLEAGDIAVEYSVAKAGYAGAVDNRGREAVLATTITDELKQEGLARDIIRTVNQARKDAGLNVADTIELYLGSDAEALKNAIASQREYISAETQAHKWAMNSIGEGAFTNDAKVDGHALRASRRRPVPRSYSIRG